MITNDKNKMDQEGVWGNHMINRQPSNFTIASTLPKKLRMSYKVIKVRHPIVFLAYSKRLSLKLH